MPADPALIALFAQGWAATRNVAPPLPRHGGFYIHVGQPDQAERYIFPRLDVDVLADLARQITQPHVFIKVCEAPEAVRAVLPSYWEIREPPTWMMTRPLEAADMDLPPGYTMTLEQKGAVKIATIAMGDVTAAQGRIVLLGDTVLFDQIATDLAHRRRGLGRALMQRLSSLAIRQGAPNGLLSATEMGRALYGSIGWTVHAPYTSAVIPVGTAPAP